MRLLIDLQCCQNGSRHRGIGRYAMAMTKAIAATGRFEVQILLTDKFPGSIAAVRRELDGVIPQESIFICQLFDKTRSASPPEAWRNRAAEIVRSEFIVSLAPDFVFVPSLFEGFWDEVVVSVEPGSPRTIVTLHDLIPLVEPERYMPERRDQDAYARKIRDARRADLLLPISSFTAGQAIDWLGVSPDRVAIALNGVDERFRPIALDEDARVDLLARHGISRPFVFNASPLEHRKNIEGLIAGFASMSPTVRDAHQLVIAGRMDAYARRYIADLAAGEGLHPDALVLPGYVSDADLVLLYSQCALFCFVPLSEGFGLPPLEAMACGAPVIASNTTSLPEVIGRADMLVDPQNIPEIGAAMERVLADPVLAAQLRVYGIERGRELSWDHTARAALDAIEQLMPSPAPDRQSPVRRDPAASRLAVVLPCLSSESGIVARSVGLLTALLDRFDVRLVVTGAPTGEPWLEANFEIRDKDWLLQNAGWCDAIIYIGGHLIDDAVADLMQAYPGIFVLLDDICMAVWQPPRTAAMPRMLQRMLLEKGGLGALTDGPDQAIDRSAMCEFAADYIAEHSALLLREENSDREGLPRPPYAMSITAAEAMRGKLGVSIDRTLVVAIASDADSCSPYLKRFRQAACADAVLALQTLSLNADEGESATHLVGSVRRLNLSLHENYRGLLSAADLLFVSADLDPRLREQIEADAAAIGLHIVTEQDSLVDLLHDRSGRQVRPQRVAPTVSDPAVLAWTKAITASVEAVQKLPLSLAQRVAAELPAGVRGVVPTVADVHDLSEAVRTNAQLAAPRSIYLDISAFASPVAIRRIDPIVHRILVELLRQGGRAITPVYIDGGRFVTSYVFVGRQFGFRDLCRQDASVTIFPGDKILGLDLFDSFSRTAMDVLKASQDRGAALLYALVGDEALKAGVEAALAKRLLEWADRAKPVVDAMYAEPDPAVQTERLSSLLRMADRADVAVQLLRISGLERADVARRREGSSSDASFAVMGHLLGSYSLAIINRAVARTLDHAHPGRVRFLAYETDPIHHTEGVPAAEQPLMIELCERADPSGREIVISQHWPILKPQGTFQLAFALFPWEETSVPQGVVRRLDDGFDAIIAPSRMAAAALLMSGSATPIAAIGQPVDVSRFAALNGQREHGKPILNFLHVSSCFERKGVDVLLKAWAIAFTAQDGVSLTIKTFPNPHNTVEAQVAELRRQSPDIAPITIVNHDVASEEMPAFYAAADVIVLPSRGEGYNLPALEAMAAGLPLIVTGFGGHRDFCGPRQARLIDYRFARSASHLAAGHSMWAEPDVYDLVDALREYADPDNRDIIEQRRLSALDAAAVEMDATAWLRRFHTVADSLLGSWDASAPKVGWVSTWAVRCGIAQYSSYLLDRMSADFRTAATVLCDDRTPPDKHADIRHAPVWKLRGDKADDIVRAAVGERVEAIVIQHQDGLISWAQFGMIGHDPRLEQFVSVAILHNAGNLARVSGEELGMIVSGMARFTRVLVHTLDDLNYLLSLGLDRNVALFPHGAFTQDNARWPRRLSSADAPIIGCHGFFFRHKGIDKLIRAVAILRQEWPDLRLRLVNARFPDPAHDRFIEECRALAAELGIASAIEWHLDFLPVEEIESLLVDCDVIALPYDESDDSASGAIRSSLATMTPIVATRVKIFAELGDAVQWADGHDPAQIAEAIAALLRDPRARREVQARTHDWLVEHDWDRVASTLEKMVSNLVRERRLGWSSLRSGMA